MGKTTEDTSLSTKAYTILRHRILRGELPLGEVMSRRKIAAEFGMSLLPVMEALVRLEFEGLLESRPRAGTRVRIPTREDVIGHSVVREALEGQAARLVVSHATAAERESLLKLAVRVDIAQNSDQVQFATLHQRFHLRVVECTHVPALLKAVESTHAMHSIWLCARVPRLPGHARNDREHQELARALTVGTPEEAEHEMRQHVARGFQQIMDGLEPYFKVRKMRGETYSRTAPKNSLALTPA